MELRLPLEMSPGREAACRAVFGTWGFFPDDARAGHCPILLTSFTGWSSERCPGIGFLPKGTAKSGCFAMWKHPRGHVWNVVADSPGHAHAGPVGGAGLRPAGPAGSGDGRAGDLHDRRPGEPRHAEVPQRGRAALHCQALRVQRHRSGPSIFRPIDFRSNDRMRPLLFALLRPASLCAQEFDFYARGPYRPAVPRPEVVTGHAAGERHTMYAVMQRYLETLLVTAGDRARVERWGEPAEGRPIRALLISAPENLARLEENRTQAADLADPRRTTAARAAEIAARNPVIALFQYSIHGNEAAGFEAAMQVAYQLLA